MSAPVVEDRTGRRRVPSAAPGADRLPAPVKERRPALAALAVLLIVGGALASGLVALRSGQRSDYVVLRVEVAPGEQITAADLGTASIAGTGARAIPAGDRSRLVGQYATTRVFTGTLATWAMFAQQPAIPRGSQEVGAVLGAAQRPAGPLREGDVVAVYVVPRADASGTTAQFLANATVTAVGDPNGSSGLPVSLQVAAAVVQQVESAAALNQLAIIGLPAGTNTATGQPSTGAGAPTPGTGQQGTGQQGTGQQGTGQLGSGQPNSTSGTGSN